MIFPKDIHNWSELYIDLTTNENNLSQAGKEFEQFAKLYFQCEPIVRDEYQHVWLFNEIPLQVRKHLGLGNRDYGIDLVLQDQEGRFSVVQCKFKQDQNSRLSWSKDKLANLLADGDKADFFIIFTNTSGIDAHTHTKKQNKLKVFNLGDLIQVSPDTLEAMRQMMLGSEAKPPVKKTPRDDQQIAISKVEEGFKNNARGKLILPCGTGKTMISLWIHERMNPKYTLVLLPSLALLRQTKNEWSANRKEYVPYICVCSEKDIDKGDSIEVGLYHIGVGPVSTDPDEIRTYLQQHPKVIVFSTYQSLRMVAEAIKETEIEFDLALCDEAHKTAGSKKSAFAFIHDDSNIRIRKRLYMTATLRILGENVKKSLNEDVRYIADMNDVKLFGQEFHHMTFKEAIELGILVDYQIIGMGVNDTEIADIIKERRYINDNVTADEIAHNYALEKFMKKYESVHAITFHGSIAKAEKFQDRHSELFRDVKTLHVNGKQTTNERNLILKVFEDSPKSVVTNARCLTEGVDVPAIDSVYFCDPKSSKVDIVQAVGRALRRADHLGKKIGYIVVPIFHHNRDKIEEAIDESVFKAMVSVVRAMGSHDERLVDEIRRIKLGMGPTNMPSGHLIVDGSLNLIKLEDMGALGDLLFDQVVSKIGVPWRSFEEARAFVHTLNLKSRQQWIEYSKLGNKPEDIPANPISVYKDNGWVSMGDWLGTNRIAHQLKKYRDFPDARAFAQGLNLKNGKEWNAFSKTGKKPDDIPADPRNHYKDNGWEGMGDWLGTSNRKGGWRSFENARAFVHTLNIKGQTGWKVYCKNGKPEDIPTKPDRTYKKQGWKNWGDWLGTGVIATYYIKYRDFQEARAFVHTLNLKTGELWQIYCNSGNKPDDIPADPRNHYKGKGWKGMGDWLGTGRMRGNAWRPFEEARAFVHILNIKDQREWNVYRKSRNKPVDIPSGPDKAYENKGWKGWGDWLGTGKKRSKYKLFEEARAFVRSLNLKTRDDWQKYSRSGNKPEDIPTKPNDVYRDKGWVSWADWLG